MRELEKSDIAKKQAQPKRYPHPSSHEYLPRLQEEHFRQAVKIKYIRQRQHHFQQKTRHSRMTEPAYPLVSSRFITKRQKETPTTTLHGRTRRCPAFHGSRISSTVRPGGRRRVQHRRIVRLRRLFSCTSRMLWGSGLVFLLTRRKMDITTLMAVTKRNSEHPRNTKKRIGKVQSQKAYLSTSSPSLLIEGDGILPNPAGGAESSGVTTSGSTGSLGAEEDPLEPLSSAASFKGDVAAPVESFSGSDLIP